ncbi:hypothetical protein GCM10023116_01770 [Kistimonas scapharcae]|uniref:Major capsid protein n=1 Tax=Kistimonas scapharcae TaxID=1036133 RepID=A0ABP8UYK2_9GAMM
MAQTDFTQLLDNEKNVWTKRAWKHAREHSFIMKFAGTGMNSMIQRITELTKTERGEKAIIRLVPDLEGVGVTGDFELEGHEEALKAFDTEIFIDQLRNATRNKGRMNDQKTVINFRTEAKDKLGFWLANIIDQMAFLTMAGVSYDKTTTGADRTSAGNPTGYKLSDLSFASRVTAPSAARHFRVSGTDIVEGDTSAITPTDTLSYNALLAARAHMKNRHIRGVRSKGGEEFYHVFLNPLAYLKLKQDPDYKAALQHAAPRGSSNPIFSGNSVKMDGMVLHEYHHVYNTSGAADGAKWGAAGDVDGCRVALCGAQSLAMCTLDDGAVWDEKTFDYGNNHGIAVGKIFGLEKAKLPSKAEKTEQDFGMCVLDCAI